MCKLLSANFSRLWKSRVFWLFEVGTLFFSIVAYLLVGVNVKNMGAQWILKNANFYLYFVLLYVCVLTAIFSSIFLGTEYSDGTLRNKLIVGHSRKDIYLSNWVVNAAITTMFIMTHYVVAVVIGIPIGGMTVISAIDHLLLKFVFGFMIALTYTSIFTMTTMLDSNKARCAVVSILTALLLIIVGFFLFSALEQPELKYQMIQQSDGSYLMDEHVPNPRYVGGNMRIVYTILESIMPTAFALRIASDSISYYHLIGCAMLSVLLTIIGMVMFKKKDIK